MEKMARFDGAKAVHKGVVPGREPDWKKYDISPDMVRDLLHILREMKPRNRPPSGPPLIGEGDEDPSQENGGSDPQWTCETDIWDPTSCSYWDESAWGCNNGANNQCQTVHKNTPQQHCRCVE